MKEQQLCLDGVGAEEDIAELNVVHHWDDEDVAVAAKDSNSQVYHVLKYNYGETSHL
jgi:hypothetical protein